MSDIETTGTPAPAEAAPENQPIENQEVEAEEVVEEAASEEPAAEEPAAAKEKAIKAEIAALKKKFKLKVDGKEEEVELDLNNEEELKSHLQLSKAAQKRMQEAAQYKKDVADFFKALKENPLSVLADPSLGVDVKKLAEMVMNNEIEEMKKTPEQKEKERLQKELEAIKKEREEEKKRRDEDDFKRLTEQATQQLDNEISSALNESGLPKHPRTVAYMAEALKLALKNDINLSAKDVVPLIKKQVLNDFREIMGSLPDDELEKYLGKDIISKVRKRSIQRVKQSVEAAQNIKQTGEDIKKKANEEEKKISFKDFFKPF